MMNILFRSDASSTIGTGHIMRDLVLAEQYPESRIIFATQALEGNLNTKILENGHKVEDLGSNDVEELINLVEKLSVDMVVIDHYGIDHIFEKELKRRTDIQLMVLDDMYEKHYCDILLNHNIYADEERYKNLVPKSCEIKCGSRYTLLRREFMEAKKKTKGLESNSIKIFIAMGGTDHSNSNIKILNALQKSDNIKIDIVTTEVNPHLAELKEYIQDRKYIQLHINSHNVAALMKKCTFAIVTPSVTVNEIFYMEVPFIAIKTADNQKEMYQYLKENDHRVLEYFDEREFMDHVDSICH